MKRTYRFKNEAAAEEFFIEAMSLCIGYSSQGRRFFSGYQEKKLVTVEFPGLLELEIDDLAEKHGGKRVGL